MPVKTRKNRKPKYVLMLGYDENGDEIIVSGKTPEEAIRVAFPEACNIVPDKYGSFLFHPDGRVHNSMWRANNWK